MVAPTPNGVACGEIESMTLKALDVARNRRVGRAISGRGCELPATPASGTHSVAALDRSLLVCNRPFSVIPSTKPIVRFAATADVPPRLVNWRCRARSKRSTAEFLHSCEIYSITLSACKSID